MTRKLNTQLDPLELPNLEPLKVELIQAVPIQLPVFPELEKIKPVEPWVYTPIEVPPPVRLVPDDGTKTG